MSYYCTGSPRLVSYEEPAADLLRIAFAQCVMELSKASYSHPSFSFREKTQPNLELYDYNALCCERELYEYEITGTYADA